MAPSLAILTRRAEMVSSIRRLSASSILIAFESSGSSIINESDIITVRFATMLSSINISSNIEYRNRFERESSMVALSKIVFAILNEIRSSVVSWSDNP